MRLNQTLTEGLLSVNAIPFAACICQRDGFILKANSEFDKFRHAWPLLFKSLDINLLQTPGKQTITQDYFTGVIGLVSLSKDEFIFSLCETQNNENSHQDLVDSLANSAAILNQEGMVLYSNKLFKKLLGEDSLDQFILKNSELNKSKLNQAIKGKTKSLVLSLQTKKIIRFDFQAIKHNSKPSSKTLVISHDISIAENYQKDIAKLTMIAESDLIASAILNDSAQLEWCNSTFQKLLGYRLDELLNLDPLNFLKGPNTNKKAGQRLKNAIKNKSIFSEEICLYTKEQLPIWVKINLSPIKNSNSSIDSFALVMREIGDEIETRNLLNHQLLQNDGILKAVPDLIYRVNGDGYYLSCHAFNEKDLLIPLKEIKGMKFFDMPESEELKKKVWKKIILALRTGKVQTIEYDRKNISGEQQSFESRISKSGPNEVVYFVRNITDRKLAQEKIEESERKWKSIIQNGFDGIILLDQKGIIKDFTPNVSKHFQLKPSGLRGKSVLDYLSESQSKDFSELVTNFIIKKKKRVQKSFRFNLKNSKPIIVEASIINLLQDKAVQAIVVNYRDITERTLFESQLLEANNNLKAIINNTGDHIWLIDRNFRFVMLNKPFIKYIKSSLGDSLKEGSTLHNLSSDFSREFWIKKLDQTFNDGVKVQFEASDSNGHTYSTALYPIKNKHGYTVAISVFSVNITEKVEYEVNLSKNKKTIDTILKTTSAGIFILDGLKMIYNNEQCTKILGRSTEELRSKTIDHLVHPDDRIKVLDRAISRSGGNNSPLHYSTRILKKNGEIKWLDVHSGTIHYEGINATIATILDITDQKIHEEKLIEAKEMAEELTRLKSNFLANMSHEIRTPLNGVLGLSELISLTDNLDEIREMTELQKISGKRLLDTLTSILHLSRLEAENNNVHLVRIQLPELLAEIQKVNLPNFKSKGLYLKLSPLDKNYYCLADETMLFQVFNNLLGNALKFTDKGGIEILHEVYKNKEGVSIIEIAVKDSGIGISEDFLPHIFESFRQESQGLKRKYEGSGLGLAIAKKYLNLLNGDLKVESNKGKGSTFYVSIPLKDIK